MTLNTTQIPESLVASVSRSTLINADCFDVFPFIEDKSIDAIICDLPYGTTACKWDSIINLDLMWTQYNRIIKDNGIFILFADEPFTSILINSNIKNFKQRITWDKQIAGGHLNAKKMLLKRTEDICLFSNVKNGKYTYNPILKDKDFKNIRDRNGENRKEFKGGYVGKHNSTLSKEHNNKKSYPDNLISFSARKGDCNPINRLHPTQKPLSLMEYLIKTYTNEGNLVLDNTMGSGTTILAAIKNNRIGIGIEKEKQYYDVAVRRASEYCH